MNPTIPKCKIKNLPEKERKVFILLIRELCKVCDMFKKMHKRGYGIEETEESIIKLVNEGFVKIGFDKNSDNLFLMLWDGQKYI